MQARKATLMEVVTFCEYKGAWVGLLLTVGRNNLVSGKVMMVAGGTLGSSTAPTLGSMALEGRVGLMMARKSRIAVLRSAALMAVIVMVFCSLRSMSHAAWIMRSAVEIVGIVQWPG